MAPRAGAICGQAPHVPAAQCPPAGDCEIRGLHQADR